MKRFRDGHRALPCWKEIARYLGVSVSTAQRWHASLKMPVYHVGRTGRVFAYRAELDQWIRRQPQPAMNVI